MDIRDAFPESHLSPEQEQWLCAYRGYLKQGWSASRSQEKACALTGVDDEELSHWLTGDEYCETDFECKMFDLWDKYHKPRAR